jgi:pSer/pThr/pTyr-binding forkhead associated (FHA) protein
LGEPVRILLEDGDGRKRSVPFAGADLTVGRAPESGLLLSDRDVSRRHARLHRSNGSVWVEDLGSANGTRVNGERIQGRRRIGPGDLVQIGGFDLAVEGADADAPDAAAPAPPPLPGATPAPAEPSAVARLRPVLALSAARAVPSWRPLALLAAVALAAVAVGYGAGKVLRSPAAPEARARQ